MSGMIRTHLAPMLYLVAILTPPWLYDRRRYLRRPLHWIGLY